MLPANILKPDTRDLAYYVIILIFILPVKNIQVKTYFYTYNALRARIQILSFCSCTGSYHVTHLENIDYKYYKSMDILRRRYYRAGVL